MSIVLLVLGLALIGFTLLEALWTTLSQQGAAPLSKRLARTLWRLVIALDTRFGCPRLLRSAGTVALLAVALLWVGLMWAGWMLLFSAAPEAVVHGSTGEAANAAARFYFVGYTLFTLGMGTYTPIGPPWEIATALATFNGLFLVTLTIAYLLPVISAVVSKRSLATALCTLGDTPTDILTRAWNGEDFTALEQALPSYVLAINEHAQHHLAYPIIHYFHDPSPKVAIGPPLVRLCEALDVLAAGVRQEAQPSALVLGTVRGSIRSFLATLQGAYIHAGDTPPPPLPDLGALENLGVPLHSKPEYRQRMADFSDARCLLHALLDDSNQSWTDAVAPESED